MQPPHIPDDEAERLTELRALDLLDSDPEERFDRYARLARRLFDVPIALVTLVDEDRQWFKAREGLAATETPREVSFCGHAILDDRILVVEDATRDERFTDNPLVNGDPDIRFYAGYPLAGPNGHRLGTLCIIDRRPRTLAVDDLVALRDIGEMVSAELGSFQLATTDELTGLSNRRGFLMLAKQALAMAKRSSDPASVVMLDVDGLKAINDTHGHAAGDAALVELAVVLLETLRESDVVARLGGDEFCALLTGADEAQASRAAGRLRAAVARRNQKRAAPYPLSVSVGVAACDCEQEETVARALRSADLRMYEDKRRDGRGLQS